MKKMTKKLTLNKETVKQLDTSELARAQGGTLVLTDRCIRLTVESTPISITRIAEGFCR